MRTIGSILLCCFFCLSLIGCSSRQEVNLLPAFALTASSADLQVASEVLQRRLDLLGVEGQAAPAGNYIAVQLSNTADLEELAPLLTEVSAIELYGSELPPPVGGLLPEGLEELVQPAEILSAQVQEGQNGWVIILQFDQAATGRIADYSTNHIGESIVIVRDQIVLLAPIINAPLTDGVAWIEGDYSEAEARLLAAQIGGGMLPFALDISTVD